MTPVDDEIVVEAEAPAPDAGPERVTVVRPDELPASADVATAVQRAPGVVVRRLGGLGDLAQVGIRGASARHTEVLLDGIPLNPEGGSAVDLSELPVRALDRVEVWRGSAPALLGTTALGGAVALWTRHDAAAEGALSVGSWATARGTAVLGGPVPGGSALVAVEGLQTNGAFPYLDDGGTRGNPDDDGEALRDNNDTTRLVTTSRLTLGSLTLLHAGTWSEDGVPGFVFAPTTSVRYGLSRHLLAARVDGERAAVRGWWLQRDEALTDLLGEIGVGAEDVRTRTSSIGGDGQVRALLTPSLRLDLLAGARSDRLRSEDLLSGTADAPRGREVLRASAGLPWAGSGVDVRPSLGLVALLSEDGAGEATSAFLPVPRLAVGWAVDRTRVTLDAGATARPPDLLELYGDRGAMVGNPDLRPERGWSLDLGVGRPGVELAGFVATTTDLVVLVPSAQGPVRAENLAAARVVGLEGAGEWGGDPLSVRANATLMDARQLSDDPEVAGRGVPRVPLGELLVVGRGTARWLTGSIDASVTSATWADTANIRREAARVLLGATAGATLGQGWALELDVRNALDRRSASVPRDPLVDDGIRVRQPLQDFGGYPLPGRTFLLTLTFAAPDG
ncbi:MAG: TonB-dependent receptor [Alphaproteobacteria bacterium]|nr:TonB-dependent receptor [Alphaproteobacteria bacterium]MCB9697423.1 TonB-dependent receptor [Alphaproteobacteria bacterium]